MCGFCGIVGPERVASPERVGAMARALAHRGPDDFGTWGTPFRVGDEAHAVAFGHARLSILDLSPLGHQPMQSSDGSFTVAYNGEIYNFRAVRDELRAKGASFRSECDTEVLLEAYRAWGLEAFDRFVGMFAFAIWDEARQRLVLARDRLGIKPLFYLFDDGLLLFGSELGALRAHPRFDPTIDREALGDFLQRGYVTGPRTIYTKVRRLMPGDYLVWERGRVSIGTWWRLADPAEGSPPADFPAVVDRLVALLGDAVELRLVADVPLGAFLSGGVDSSAVVSLMAERAAKRVRTFSIGFRDEAWDEAPFAAAVARHLGTDHTELYVGWDEAAQVAHELPDLYDEPFGDSSAIPTVLLSRLTRRHVTVALSGDGGDELFGGYTHYRKLAQLLPGMRLPAPLRRLLAGLAPRVPHHTARRALRHLAGARAVDLAASLLRTHERRDVLAVCGSDGESLRGGYREIFETAPVAGDVQRAMIADARTYLPDDILTKVDRASMSVGLEARVPILDHRVVRFAYSLPLETIWHGGRTKAPLREVAYRRIPRELIDRPKRGFGIPLELLLRDEIALWKARHLAPARLAEDGLLEPHGVERLVRDSRPFAAGGTSPLWYLLCFQRWFARHHRGEALD